MTQRTAKKSTARSEDVVIDAAGLPVDCAGHVWKLNSAAGYKAIDWRSFPVSSDSIKAATVQFIRHMIETQSASSVRNSLDTITLVFRSASFVDADRSNETIPFAMFTELRSSLGHAAWRLHHIRQWYGWCANFGFANFSPDVAFQADQMSIGGNRKGHAVLSADPEQGPLTDGELAALLTALKAARGTTKLSLDQQAALWLCVALGPNPMQMAMLVEDDLIQLKDGDQTAFVHLRVPRMKKRENEARSSFRTRGLTREIAEVLLELIDLNSSRELDAGAAGPRSRPIFQRRTPRADLVDGPLDRFAWHLRADEFTGLVESAVAALGVLSPRTGKPLNITTRRLRYTFATRLVREGVPKLEVADLLDHSDTQNVQIYYDIKSDIVQHLDRAVAMALAPLAQAFMGTLVSGPGDAVRGSDPDSSIGTVAGDPGRVEKLGNCGSFGFCGLMAPISCYTCKSFQPWIDAPHHLVLDQLLKDRDRRVDGGLDARMVTMMDTTICAVAEVISRIEAATVPAS